QLSYNANSQSQEGTEVLSYSFWSGKESVEDTGYNSAGKELTGSSRNTVADGKITLPPFSAPETAGTYIARFKVDWNSINPAGRVGSNGSAADSDNGILTNGGFIVDVAIAVNVPDAVQEPLKEHGEMTVYDLSGRKTTLPSSPSSRHGIYIVNGEKVVR
ncbi:MAG: hypothetical protein K6E45_04960, partial [Bacteroidaceae bacterium]|nr:hypothetical protein [Bacteroidaceae bacterium]